MIASPLSVLILSATLALAAAQRDACYDAAMDCNFRFMSYPTSVPAFDITGPADVATTPRLMWKDNSKRVGIVNSNSEGAIITNRGDKVPLSKFPTPGQRFSPLQFKPFTILRTLRNGTLVPTPYSGIGYENFQGNVATAKGRCVLVRITEYQVLDGSKPPNVIRNARKTNQCVVFRTRN